ncbi:MAG: hypothetical protein R2698_10705 [Microthrixaceae bacterium]
MSVRDLHAGWAWLVVATTAVSGTWCTVAHWKSSVRVSAVWWTVIAAQAAVAVQVLLGVYLLGVDRVKAPGLHVVYGFAALIAMMIMYAYRHQMRPQLYLLYGVGNLFLTGIALREVVLA